MKIQEFSITEFQRKHRFFFCVGAQKAGTTTLHDSLKDHPEICLPISKEAHFFDIDSRYKKGLEWYYSNFFSHFQEQEVLGVFNPEYIYFEDVPERIFNAYGSDIKLIFIFRNPVDRAFSHYQMSKRRLRESQSFEDAIDLEEERIQRGYQDKSDFSYLSRGYYSNQVKRYLNYFPKENMIFFRFEEDLIKNRSETLRRIHSFLGVSPIDINLTVRSNSYGKSRSIFLQQLLFKKNSVKTILGKLLSKQQKIKLRTLIEKFAFESKNMERLDPELRRKLLTQYIEDIRELESITSVDFSNWIIE